MKKWVILTIVTSFVTFSFGKASNSITIGRYGQFSKNGQLLVFQTKKALVSQDLDRDWDVYLYNLSKKSFSLVSKGKKRGAYGGASINSDGTIVAYHAYSLSVLMARSPRASEIIRHDLTKNESTILTSDIGGESMRPQMSGDGNIIVFTSNDPIRQIYVYNHRKGSMRVIGQKEGQPLPDRPSLDPQVSEDGNWIIFRSAATNLDPPQKVGLLGYHLYLTNRKKDRTMRIDRGSFGFNADRRMVGKSDINADGRWIVFDAYDRKAGSANKMLQTADIFLFDRRKSDVTRLTRSHFKGKSRNPSIDGRGRFVVFEFLGFKKDRKGGLVVWDRKQKRFQKILDRSCRNPRLSPDGRMITYVSKGQLFVCPNPFLN